MGMVNLWKIIKRHCLIGKKNSLFDSFSASSYQRVNAPPQLALAFSVHFGAIWRNNIPFMLQSYGGGFVLHHRCSILRQVGKRSICHLPTGRCYIQTFQLIALSVIFHFPFHLFFSNSDSGVSLTFSVRENLTRGEGMLFEDDRPSARHHGTFDPFSASEEGLRWWAHPARLLHKRFCTFRRNCNWRQNRGQSLHMSKCILKAIRSPRGSFRSRDSDINRAASSQVIIFLFPSSPFETSSYPGSAQGATGHDTIVHSN
jgi:hypothetical protein